MQPRIILSRAEAHTHRNVLASFPVPLSACRVSVWHMSHTAWLFSQQNVEM